MRWIKGLVIVLLLSLITPSSFAACLKTEDGWTDDCDNPSKKIAFASTVNDYSILEDSYPEIEKDSEALKTLNSNGKLNDLIENGLDPGEFSDADKNFFMGNIAQASALAGNVDMTDPQFKEAIQAAFGNTGIMAKNSEAASQFINTYEGGDLSPEALAILTSAKMDADGKITLIDDPKNLVTLNGKLGKYGLEMDIDGYMGNNVFLTLTTVEDSGGDETDEGGDGDVNNEEVHVERAENVHPTEEGIAIDSGTVSYYYPDFSV